MAFPTEERVAEVATAGHYMLALSEGGEVYSWGKNSGNTCEVRGRERVCVCVCVCACVCVCV